MNQNVQIRTGTGFEKIKIRIVFVGHLMVEGGSGFIYRKIEHETLSAGSHIDHGVRVAFTVNHRKRKAGKGRRDAACSEFSFDDALERGSNP